MTMTQVKLEGNAYPSKKEEGMKYCLQRWRRDRFSRELVVISLAFNREKEKRLFPLPKMFLLNHRFPQKKILYFGIDTMYYAYITCSQLLFWLYWYVLVGIYKSSTVFTGDTKLRMHS